MSQKNLQIKSTSEIDEKFLSHFRPLEDYQTANLSIDKNIENKFERIIEKEASRIKADLAIITSINEMPLSGTSNKQITFYQKKYKH